MNTHLPLQWAYKPRLASEGVKKKKCICMTSVLKSVFCPPFLVRSFTLPSFWKLGGWGFHLNRQACASLVGDSLTERVKRERAREMERKERENVRGVFHATRRCNSLQEHDERSANGSSRTARRMEGFHGYPQSSLLAPFLSVSCLLFPLSSASE